jgi:hypothetical protein
VSGLTGDERDDPVRAQLSALRAAMAAVETPHAVKAAAMSAFRAAARDRRRRRLARYGWCAAACAAVFVAGLFWRLGGGGLSRPAPAAPAITRIQPSPDDVVAAPPAVAPVVVRRAHTGRRQMARNRPGPAPQNLGLKEVATDFFSLPYAPPLDPADGGQIVRVMLPRTAMRTVGLPVVGESWTGHVPADVVLGQDGVARAVRFVRIAQ